MKVLPWLYLFIVVEFNDKDKLMMVFGNLDRVDIAHTLLVNERVVI